MSEPIDNQITNTRNKIKTHLHVIGKLIDVL